MDKSDLPLRPSPDPTTLGEQLRQSLMLQSPPTGMEHYKGYLAQIIKKCVQEIAVSAACGKDIGAIPKKWLDIMAPALHQVERIQYVEPEVAREVWMVQWMLEVAIEALTKAAKKDGSK